MDLIEAMKKFSARFEGLEEGEEIKIEEPSESRPEKVYTCDQFRIQLSHTYAGDDIRVERVFVLGPANAFRALGSLCMLFAMRASRDDVCVIDLPESGSVVRALRLEHGSKLWTGRPTEADFSIDRILYMRQAVGVNPFGNLDVDKKLLPSLNRIGCSSPGTVAYDDSARSQLVGFGGLHGLMLMAGLFVDLSFPEPGRDEVSLRQFMGRETGVSPGSVHITLGLPSCDWWPT